MGVGTFSGNANYKIDVDARLTRQSGQVSYIYWRIYVIKSGTPGYLSQANPANSGWADSNVGINKDLWNKGNMAYNFQNASLSGTFLIAEGNFSITHRANGTQEYSVKAALDFLNLGHAEAGTGTRALPRIQKATVPAAPTPLSFGIITMTSIEYRFKGNSNGGLPTLGWEMRIQDATTKGPLYTAPSSGTSVRSGLTPGHVYYFWSRGRNALGWGPWSVRTSATTVVSTDVRYNGSWRNAVPYVKYGGTWRAARPYVKVNGVWRRTG